MTADKKPDNLTNWIQANTIESERPATSPFTPMSAIKKLSQLLKKIFGKKS